MTIQHTTESDRALIERLLSSLRVARSYMIDVIDYGTPCEIKDSETVDKLIAEATARLADSDGEPDQALLISMATCLNHGFRFLAPAQQQSMLHDMRKLWDEVQGRGYYSPATLLGEVKP